MSFTVSMWGPEVADSETEMHVTKYSKQGDVVMQYHHHWPRGGEVQIVSVLKETRNVPARRYVASLGILPLCLAEVGRQSCRRQEGTKYTLRNRLVVWSTAILTYLPVLPFHIIII